MKQQLRANRFSDLLDVYKLFICNDLSQSADCRWWRLSLVQSQHSEFRLLLINTSTDLEYRTVWRKPQEFQQQEKRWHAEFEDYNCLHGLPSRWKILMFASCHNRQVPRRLPNSLASPYSCLRIVGFWVESVNYIDSLPVSTGFRLLDILLCFHTPATTSRSS